MMRIPLEDRLEALETCCTEPNSAPNIQKVFFIRLDEYFKGLSSLSRDPCFRRYLNEIRTSPWADWKLACYLIRELLAEDSDDDDFYDYEDEYGIEDEEKEDEKYDAWYRVLIEPFVRIAKL